jgi:hypothetical protein
MPQVGFNPQSKQANGRRPTPYAAWAMTAADPRRMGNDNRNIKTTAMWLFLFYFAFH